MKSRVWAGLASSEVSLPGLQMAISSLCPHWSSLCACVLNASFFFFFLFEFHFPFFFYTAGSHQSSIPHILVYTCQSQSPNPSPAPASPPWCLSYKDTSRTGSGPTHSTSFYPSHLFKGPVSKCNHTPRCWGLGRRHMKLGCGTQFSPKNMALLCCFPHVPFCSLPIPRGQNPRLPISFFFPDGSFLIMSSF